MKKIFFVIAILILLAALIGLLWTVMQKPPKQNPQQTGLPISGVSTTTPGMTVRSYGGGSLTLKDFLHDPATKEDPSNKGYYYLGNQPNVASPYLIEYISQTNYFNIILLQEPLGQARMEAETYLLEHTGLTQNQLCALDYMVSTPDFVNNIYSDEHLGFSFCPGAVQLP